MLRFTFALKFEEEKKMLKIGIVISLGDSKVLFELLVAVSRTTHELIAESVADLNLNVESWSNFGMYTKFSAKVK